MLVIFRKRGFNALFDAMYIKYKCICFVEVEMRGDGRYLSN